MRFGSVEFDADCNPTYNKVQKSAEVYVTNSVFQLHLTQEFLPHCPNFVPEIKFLTTRPAEYTICRFSFEWIHIWLEETAVWVPTESDWIIQYNFYNPGGGEIGDYFQTVEPQTGAVMIAMGPNNPGVVGAIPDGTSYYTVRIFGWQETPGGPQLRQYSETITRHLSSCNCWAAEIYFLGDAGDWQTVVFETLESREVDQLQIEIETPLNWDFTTRGYIYPEGERSTYVEEVDQIFAFATGRIDQDWKRKQVEELLRSPEIYIRTAGDLGQAIRRVIPELSRFSTFTRSEAIHAIIGFRFNARTRNH